MAHASHHNIGPGSKGKGAGGGAMTEVDRERIPDSGILSNSDKSEHSQRRGLDSKETQTEALRDHEANQLGPKV